MSLPSELFVIGPRDGFTPRVGVLTSELDNARHYLHSATRGIDDASLHQRPRLVRNSVAEILAHLIAVEALMRAITFEDRRLDPVHEADVIAAAEFSQEQDTSLDVAWYRDALTSSRGATLAGLRERDDAWLDTPKTFTGRPANVHYYWLHFLQDEVRHTGQIILIRKYLLPNADPDLNPYTPRP